MQQILKRALFSVAMDSLFAIFCTAAFAQGSARAAIEVGNKRFARAVARGDAPPSRPCTPKTRNSYRPTVKSSADARRSRASGREVWTRASNR